MLLGKKLPTEINKFLGLNMDVDGETQLKLGESPGMVNFKITDNYKLKKRNGYVALNSATPDKNIQGMWFGKIQEDEYFIYACDTKVYKGTNFTAYEEIGTLECGPFDQVNFFSFNDKLYLLTGYEYKYWNGLTFDDVAGYRPKIVIGTPPSGGIGGEGNGALYEQINVLTGEKHQTFSADGIATEYVLAEQGLTSVDFVKVNGVLKTVTTDYTVDLTNGKVTFVVVPTVGQDNVDIGWTKGTGQRDLIIKCRAAILYGGANDNRVFAWGNSDYKNRRFYTGLADGVPSAEYFPANYYSDVGHSQYAITDIVKQHDRQIILKENSSYYSYLETINNEAAFPVFPLNDNIGNTAFNQARTINNNPFVTFNGVYEFVTTNIKDERNVKYKSQRIKSSLDENIQLISNETWKIVKTCEYEYNKEFWLSLYNTVWVYKYDLDAWYMYKLADRATCFIVIKNELYMGTANGQIMKFANVTTDNEIAIESYWEMGFYDFDIEYITKYINKVWITLKPESKSSLTVNWQSDKATSDTNSLDFSELNFLNLYLNGITETIGYNLLNYASLNYKKWTYSSNYNPQPFRIKMKAKKFTYFKLRLENYSLYDAATVLSINFAARYGGESK